MLDMRGKSAFNASADVDTFALMIPDLDALLLRPILAKFQLCTFALQELLQNFVFQREPSGAICAAEKPAFFIGAVSGSSEGAKMLRDASSDLEMFFGTVPYDLLDLSDVAEQDHDAVVSRWLVHRLRIVCSTLLSDAMCVRQALAILRRNHEEVLERFAELESSSELTATPKLILKLNYPPSHDQINLQASDSDRPGSARRIRQTLTTFASGLACIEFKVGTLQVATGARVRVALFLGASPIAHATWNITAGRLRASWVTLRLERAVTTREQEASVEFTLEGHEGALLPLALSWPNPLTEFCAVRQDGSVLSAPLALKVWGTTPGVAVAVREAAGKPDTKGSAAETTTVKPVRFALAAHELEDVQLFAPTDITVDSNLVEFRPGNRDILVHPIKGRTMIAIIRDINVLEVQSLSAIVVVDHKDALPVEFGLSIVAHRSIHSAVETLIKHWTVVEPQTYTEVPGSVEMAPGVPFDLLLATRMLDNAATDFAWARFKRIEVVA